MLLREHLDELYELHTVCREFEQGITKRQKNWILYEPTQFIYCFFTFNAIYSDHWTASFAEGRVVQWNDRLPEKKKIQKYVTFCCDILEDDAPVVFHRFLREYMLHLDVGSVDEAERILQGIRLNARISEEEALRFRKRFRQAAYNRLAGRAGLEAALNDLLGFVYLIRNDIFHGSKTVADIMAFGQRRRFLIYTAILLAANELLFEAAHEGIDWRVTVSRGRRKRKIPPPEKPDGEAVKQE